MKFKGKICMLLAILMIATVCVMILPAAADNTSAEIYGDASRLHIEKNVFYDDEPIMVSAIGKGKDWIGLISGNNNYSDFYYYIDKSQPDGVGSGVTFNLLKSKNGEGSITLSPGKYRIALYPNDQNVSGGTPIAYANIVVKERPGADPKVVKNASYKLDNDTDGYAKGKITVETDEDQINRVDIIMYWGNDEGKLPEYGPLARFRIKGKVTVTEIPDGIIIPYGATKLMLYSRSKTGTSTTEDCFVLDLPKNAASKNYENPLFSYSVCSDIHITLDDNHENNKNFKVMLEQVTALRPNSIGNFIVGDIANSGHGGEMTKMNKIYNSVEGVADRYICAGNHDMRDGSPIAVKTMVFNKYMKLPDGKKLEHLYYDFWLEGYHFIFLGPDEITGNDYVMMSKDELDWLDKTLAENYDPNRPAFIFLHQPLPNTIVGSLENKYNQGWAHIDKRCVKRYQEILSKYPEAIMFNGHTHGILSSEANIFMGDPNLPTIINTGSVAYEWDVFDNKTYGENIKGSEGYIVDVYKDKIIVQGRNFKTSEWVPNAQYILRYGEEIPEVNPDETETETENQTSAETQTETKAPESTKIETDAPNTNNTNKNTTKVVIITVVALVVVGAAVAGIIIYKKRKK